MKEIRKIRLLKERTLDDIFIRTRIPIAKLSRIERGIYEATEKERKLIAKALGEPEDKVFPLDK
jgi:transcriptional regulator with XRE-family HTH domain